MKVVRTYGRKPGSRMVHETFEKKSIMDFSVNLSDSSDSGDSDFDHKYKSKSQQLKERLVIESKKVNSTKDQKKSKNQSGSEVKNKNARDPKPKIGKTEPKTRRTKKIPSLSEETIATEMIYEDVDENKGQKKVAKDDSEEDLHELPNKEEKVKLEQMLQYKNECESEDDFLDSKPRVRTRSSARNEKEAPSVLNSLQQYKINTDLVAQITDVTEQNKLQKKTRSYARKKILENETVPNLDLDLSKEPAESTILNKNKLESLQEGETANVKTRTTRQTRNQILSNQSTRQTKLNTPTLALDCQENNEIQESTVVNHDMSKSKGTISKNDFHFTEMSDTLSKAAQNDLTPTNLTQSPIPIPAAKSIQSDLLNNTAYNQGNGNDTYSNMRENVTTEHSLNAVFSSMNSTCNTTNPGHIASSKPNETNSPNHSLTNQTKDKCFASSELHSAEGSSQTSTVYKKEPAPPRRSRLAHSLENEKNQDYSNALNLHNSIMEKHRESLSTLNTLRTDPFQDSIQKYSIPQPSQSGHINIFELVGNSETQAQQNSAAHSSGDLRSQSRKSEPNLVENSTKYQEDTNIVQKIYKPFDNILQSNSKKKNASKINFNPLSMKAKKRVLLSNILEICGQTEPIKWDEDGFSECGLVDDFTNDIKNQDYTHSYGNSRDAGFNKQLSISPEYNNSGTQSQISEHPIFKIGEASYSEVFSATFNAECSSTYAMDDLFNLQNSESLQQKATSAYPTEGPVKVAVKIIPFGSRSVSSPSGDYQPSLGNLYQEIVSSYSLSWMADYERECLLLSRNKSSTKMGFDEKSLGSNFVKVYKICICQGEFPKPLVAAWDKWKTQNNEQCLNKRPDFYPKNQLFAMLILEYAGEPLETVDLVNWKQAQSILRQLSLSLALSEHLVNFEHRDLHWGNIMVKKVDPKISFLYRKVVYETIKQESGQEGKKEAKFSIVRIPSYGVQCTIIDYTLSRLDLGIVSSFSGSDKALLAPRLRSSLDFFGSEAIKNNLQTNGAASNDKVFFVNLKDANLFKGSGDIQFEVYRNMLDISEGRWQDFIPKTNNLWLVYVLEKLLFFKKKTMSRKKLSLLNNIQEAKPEPLVIGYLKLVGATIEKQGKYIKDYKIDKEQIESLTTQFSEMTLDSARDAEKIHIISIVRELIHKQEFPQAVHLGLEWLSAFSKSNCAIDVLDSPILMLP
ncbi:hypothetical protein BB560_002833 [Smittium megazygosporum]|uniref:non-specific serine/threonine protein kinase n=1 Tax=Smittium megazygosporum TaxID=133381 RepID=A0A2T9ZDP5_9FUNG|nr:hypothetical protein BB560_002833 [Smittium megazygosporum]